jgi:hypothetical protein
MFKNYSNKILLGMKSTNNLAPTRRFNRPEINMMSEMLGAGTDPLAKN